MSSSLRFMSALLAGLLFVAGCAPRVTDGAATTGRLPDLQPPVLSVALDGAVLSSFDPPGAGARLTVQLPVAVRNPNPFPLSVSFGELDYRLGSGGAALKLPEAADPLTVPPGSVAVQTFELSQGLRQDAELLRQAAAVYSGRPLPVTVTGSYRYSSEHHPWLTGGQLNLSARASAAGDVEMPVLTLVTADSSAWFLPDDSPVVRVIIEAVNPGSVGYLLTGKDLLLSIDGHSTAVYDLPPTPVPAGNSIRIALSFAPVPALLSPEARVALSDALAGTKAELSIEGRLALDVLGLDTWLLPVDGQLSGVIHTD